MIDINKEKIEDILNRSIEGKIPDVRDLACLAQTNDMDILYKLFSTANEIRRNYFGDKVFVYGFMYISTYCRNSCSFCRFNVRNRSITRYRKSVEEIIKIAEKMKKSGLNLVDITIGEDPYIYNSLRGLTYLLNVISVIKKEIGLPVMCSPGSVPISWLPYLKNAGVDWLAIYQETYNRKLFENLRPNQDFDYRIHVKKRARELGILIEDGILLGVGETMNDCINAIYSMRDIGASQVREMGFVPSEELQLKYTTPPLLYELKIIAMMRLIHQDKLIPASYDIDGLKSLQLRLMAGANVVTSLIPENSCLLGVANPELGMNGKRSLEYVKPYLEELGLKIARLEDYTKWIDEEKEKLNRIKTLNCT